MPVSKKRYPQKGKKRTKRIKPDIVGGYTAHIHFGCLEISDEIITAFHDDGVKYYHSGREDKAKGIPALGFDEFSDKFELFESELSVDFNVAIASAQHSQYIDGYNGAEYRERVIFERDFK